jgi:large subunit ribosomal protein L17
MANVAKLNRPTKERMSLLRNQASSLLWDGRITTTVAKAKALQSYVERILTLAIDTYTDTITVAKTSVDDKGVKTKREVLNDGAKKLKARRIIMSKLFDRQEQRQPKEAKSNFVERTEGINHPLIEKIFNVYAPKYAERNKEKNQRGGYTRVYKTEFRRGDAAQLCLVELV